MIRDTLNQWGFKGVPGFDDTCPVARFVASHGYTCWVDEDTMSVLVPGSGGCLIQVDLPQAVREFEDLFHAGRFPELIDVESSLVA